MVKKGNIQLLQENYDVKLAKNLSSIKVLYVTCASHFLTYTIYWSLSNSINLDKIILTINILL